MQEWTIIIVPILVATITQIAKFIIFSAKNGLDWNYFMTHGHMPSAHSALAISLVTTIGVIEGYQTGTFALAVVFALVILDDAVRIRMHLGDQGRYLNMLVENLKLDEKKYPRLKEHVGHRTSEVIVGVLLGFFLSLFFIWIL